MKTDNRFIYSNKGKLITTKLISDVSGKEIFTYGFLVKLFSYNGRSKIYVCSQEELELIKDYDKSISVDFNPKLYDYSCISIIFIVVKIPKSSHLVNINQTPDLKDSKNHNVFSAAINHIDNEVVRDSTVYAGRVTHKQQEGVLSLEERDQLLLDRDNELNTSLGDEATDSYLNELQSAGLQSQQLLESNKTKLLEGD
jgi:hypothetical protein